MRIISKAKTALGVSIFALSLSATVSPSLAETLTSTDQGWYSRLGVHDPNNTNIQVNSDPGGSFLRNFFTFDLTSIAAGSVISGTLTIFAANGFFFAFGDPLYRVFDYNGSISDLVAGSGIGAPGNSIFVDLGTGTAYGETIVDGSLNQPMPEVTVVLNAAAIAVINSILSGSDFGFALGGTCITCGDQQGMWGVSGTVPAAKLDLELDQTVVPLPAALPLFAGGLGLLGWMARRRRGQAAHA
jgi:hypothetical protein